jgi:hypothetical protein
MKNLLVITLWIGLLFCGKVWGQQHTELMVCGSSKLLIVDVARSKDTIPEIIWQWDAHQAQDLPEAYRTKYFEKIDECKAFDHGNTLVITSSAGGIAVIGRKNKKVKFYANILNAHSAELLPGNRLAVAGSLSARGNCVEVFDISQPEKTLFRDTLYLGHGVLWEPQEQLLYALGDDRINKYKLVRWKTANPALKLISTVMLPVKGGHELQCYKHPDSLMVTTIEQVWLFDKRSGKFFAFKPMQGLKQIKSVSYNKTLHQFLYTQGEISWWSHRVHFLYNDRKLSFPDINVYKAHWVN